MATKIQNICEFLADLVIEGGKLVFLVVATLAMTLVISPMLFVIGLVIFNPVVFIVWALLYPASAAKFVVGDDDDDKELNDLFLWGLSVWQAGDKACYVFLPWRCRRELLRVQKLKDASRENQIRFFNDEEDKEMLLKENWLSQEVVKELWSSMSAELHAVIISSRKSLDANQIQVMITNGEWSNLRLYNNNHTLSDVMLNALLKAEDPASLNFLLDVIRYKGASSSFIFNLDPKDERTKKIEEAMKVNLHLKALDKFETKTFWSGFLKREKGLAPEAQSKMNLAQYQEFKAQGYELAEGVLEAILRREDEDLIEAVIKNEVIGKDISSKAQALIHTNQKWEELLVKNS